MKIKTLENELAALETKLKKYAEYLGTAKFSERAGLSMTDVSLWVNGKREWSHKKLINISKKLEV